MVRAQQFALGEGGVDLAMADLMDRELFLALERARDQVVAIDVDRPEGTSAQGTTIICHAAPQRWKSVSECFNLWLGGTIASQAGGSTRLISNTI
jgi:hypothetical protein